MLISKPRLKSAYRLERINDDHLILISEKKSSVLLNGLHASILEELATMSVTMDQLIDKLIDTALPPQVFQAINELNEAGYITDGEAPFPEEQTAYWESLGFDPKRLANTLQNEGIAVTTIGAIDKNAFTGICRENGLNFSAKPTLHIVVTDHYHSKELDAINKQMEKSQTPWLLLKPSGTQLLIGPIFIPGQTACWTCLLHRLELNHPERKYYRSLKKSEDSFIEPKVYHPLSAQISMNIAVLEVVKWLYSKNNDHLVRRIQQLDTRDMQSTFHTVVKRPQCGTCGDASLLKKKPKPIQLQPSDRVRNTHGGYRQFTLEETYDRLKHHVSSLTGIVPYLKSYDKKQPSLIHNYSSGRNLALQSQSMFWLNHHLRSGNGGKGKNDMQAKVGALCESIERYSAMYHDEGFSITSCMKDLPDAIHPNTCMNFSKSQIDNRSSINADLSKFYSLVPIQFNEEIEMEWTPVYSLSNKKFKYLPSNFCYAQYPAEDENNLFAYPDSNGCATGNVMEEAILQGLLELIERDAIAIWWYNRIKRPAVDLKSVENNYIQEVTEYYKSIGRNIVVLDITTDINVPVFVAISYRKEGKDQIIYGFGAHVDAGIALERSVIEMNQLFPVIQEDGYLTKDDVFINWLDNATLNENDFMIPLKMEIKNMKADYSENCSPNISDSVHYCMKELEQQKLETLVLDLTQVDIGMPVVRVIVPGLRHFWKRTGPGRLYDVPVKMGWLKEKLTEGELNPLGIFV
ncbi:MAG: TOMM precursor leader peptide-binding protein [Crocinitomicaceae bacterium]|nr:TOMM precursor leader peptide-binding protein [Flavobacteriales bacterium]NQZ37839.1 TOMM precursor leader peptide-binding protein [Crocinitomicaceae bacterium]